MDSSCIPSFRIFLVVYKTLAFAVTVDRAHYDTIVAPHNWYIIPARSGRGYYVCRYSRHRTLYLHREILGISDNPAVEVDHINGDSLDNRSCNLRLATRAENCRHTRARLGAASKYKGVHKYSLSKAKQEKGYKSAPWKSIIKFGGKYHFLGYFHDEELAARAYDAKARELFGSFASLNFPEPGESSALETSIG